MNLTANDFIFQAPLLVLVLFSLILILEESFREGVNAQFEMWLTVAASLLTIAAAIYVWKALPAQGGFMPMLSGMLVADRFGMFFVVLFAGAAALTAMTASANMRAHNWERGEFFGVMLLAVSGMAMIAMANDLVAVFIGIELMSIGVYVLVAIKRKSKKGPEGAMKYFLMGAFATGFLVYGIAMIYGSTGTTSLAQIAGAADPSDPILIVGIFMVVVAFAFKIAAVPFHMWAPDAYEAAPSPVTGFMAAAVKAAAFTAILRVLTQALGGDILPVGRLGWAGILAVLAAATMTIGNIAALRQDNIKRMLAYSSVSHAGVILVGIVATGLVSPDRAQPGVMYYLAAYTVTTLGAFAVITWVSSADRSERVLISDWNGLAQSRPGAAMAMAIFMLSLGGIPPTAGFFGKFYVFESAMESADGEMLWLVIVGVLNSVVAVFYYLRVVMAMYFKEAEGEVKHVGSGAVAFVLVVCAVLVMQMGLMPSRWLGYAIGG